MELICSKCKNPKDITCFRKRPDRKRGYTSVCNECQKEIDSTRKKIATLLKRSETKKERDQLALLGLKKCTKCKKINAANDKFFNYRTDKPHLLTSWCQTCIKDHAKTSIANKRLDPIKSIAILNSKNKHRKSAKGRNRKRISSNLRYHRKRSNVFKWEEQDWDFCKNYFNNKCAYCNRQDILTQDHFIPLADPNCIGTIPGNIVPACRRCNSSKGNNDPYKWAKEEEIIKIKKYFEYLNSNYILT